MRELDQAIIRVAVANARRHVSQGSSPGEAAERATQGAWAVYRMTVLKRLQDEPATPGTQPAAPRA